MNILGLEVKLAGKNNGQYVKHSDCPEKHETIKETFNQRIDDLKNHIDTRIGDVITFLKNGK